MKANPTPSTYVHNLILIDESASMQRLHHAAIDSVNDTLRAIADCQERLSQQQQVSIFSFNGKGTRMHAFDQNVSTVSALQYDQYRPDSTTPLMDCIGQTIGMLKARQSQKLNDEQVIVTILTDGSENGSKKYCQLSISRLISVMRSAGWIFNYVGANHDVARTCERLNIANHYEFKPTPQDLQQQMLLERMARMNMYRTIATQQTQYVHAA